MEKISYDKNSSARLKYIKRFETELELIKSLQTSFPLGFTDNISKMLVFGVIPLSGSRKRNLDLKVNLYGKRIMTNVDEALQ